MKKLTSLFLAGALALSLTACGSEMTTENYSVEEEANYYHELTGEDVSCKLAISTHPSLQCGALTVPTFENTINDSWYNNANAENATLSVYKTMTVNEAYNTDSMLTLTFAGSSENLSGGLNTDTLSKYLERYFENGELKKLVKFITNEVNTDITRQENTYSGNYSVGGLECTFTNKDGGWTLEINSYYNNEISDGGLYIDKTLAQEEEPYLNESTITDFIGETAAVIDYKTVIDIDELNTKMTAIGYEFANEKYQHDESVTATANDNGTLITYYMSVVFKPTSGEGKNAVIQQSYILNKTDNTVVYRINALNEEISDEEATKIISAVTGIDTDTVNEMLKNKGKEAAVSENSTAVIDSERNFTVTTALD